MTADLHVHTRFSDGLDTPEQVVVKAKKLGLKAIAITDHDVIDGIPEALEAKKKHDLQVIPGLEFTTEIPEAEIHILGYFIDCNNAPLKEILEKIQQSRRTRIHKILEKLADIGISIDLNKVLALCGDGSAGRPHVARALIEEGVVKSIREAFHKYLGWKGPAYVPHFKLSPFEAIKYIVDAGGIAVYAHPVISNYDEIIPDLISCGLKGIEVYYPSHSNTAIKHYLDLAKKYGLLVTGGSDYHGSIQDDEKQIGAATISDELFQKFLSAKEATV